MAIDVPTKANSRTAVLLKSETRTAVLCKQSQKNQKKAKEKTQVLISGVAFSTSYGRIAIQDSSPS